MAVKEIQKVIDNVGHGFKNFDEAQQWAKSHIVGVLSDEQTNGKGEINISGKAIEKYLSGKAVQKSENKDVHLSALKVLPEIIKQSIVVETHKDKNNDSNIKDIQRLYGCLTIDGKDYRVKTTVKRYNNSNEKSKAYSYEVTEIELLEGSGIPHTQSADSMPTSSNSIIGAKLLNNVDSDKYKGEQLLNYSKVVDENGEPLVVYHGSPNEFTEFKNGVFQNTNGGEFQIGYFFTSDLGAPLRYAGKTSSLTEYDNKTSIEQKRNIIDKIFRRKLYPIQGTELFAGDKNIYSCFINIKNPMIYDFKDKPWSNADVNVEEYKIEIKEEYYDKNEDKIFDRKETIITFDNLSDYNDYIKKISHDPDTGYYSYTEIGEEKYHILQPTWGIKGYYTKREIGVLGGVDKFIRYYPYKKFVPKTINGLAYQARKEGYDGLLALNVVDANLNKDNYAINDFIPLSPNQIKSATENEDITNDPDIRYRIYGGNSGYVGYSMSKRAAQAREEGRFPKGDFKKEYGLTENAFKSLLDLGYIDDSEWHHTSKFGNKTTFYKWDEDYYKTIYDENKPEIDKLSRTKEEEKEVAKKRIESIFENHPLSQMFNDLSENYWDYFKINNSQSNHNRRVRQ